MFKCLIHFDFIFVRNVREQSSVIVLHVSSFMCFFNIEFST